MVLTSAGQTPALSIARSKDDRPSSKPSDRKDIHLGLMESTPSPIVGLNFLAAVATSLPVRVGRTGAQEGRGRVSLHGAVATLSNRLQMTFQSRQSFSRRAWVLRVGPTGS